jgi:hypothetical protein
VHVKHGTGMGFWVEIKITTVKEKYYENII